MLFEGGQGIYADPIIHRVWIYVSEFNIVERTGCQRLVGSQRNKRPGSCERWWIAVGVTQLILP